jgi:hypothetical protein
VGWREDVLKGENQIRTVSHRCTDSFSYCPERDHHAFCQSAIVLLNAEIIALVMRASFRVHVAPKIPLKLGKAYYALATAHAALGSIVECAALNILLAAGTQLLPMKLRLTRYKLWMRTVLAGWRLAVARIICVRRATQRRDSRNIAA